MVLICASVVYFALHVYSLRPNDGQHYTLVFDNAVGLKPDSPVSVAGVDIGLIDEVKLVNNFAHINIVVKPEVVLHEDAFAEIRARSLLGEKYIALHAGSSQKPTLAASSTLSKNPSPIDVDLVIMQVGSLLAKVNALSSEFSFSDLQTMKHESLALLRKLNNLTNIGVSLLSKTLSSKGLASAREMFELSKSVLGKIDKLLDKADAIDEAAIRDMLQIDGIKVRLWASDKAKEVVKQSK